MTKPLSEWTLKEVQEMCNKTQCKDCKFSTQDIEHICKLTHNFMFEPCDWELE